ACNTCCSSEQYPNCSNTYSFASYYFLYVKNVTYSRQHFPFGMLLLDRVLHLFAIDIDGYRAGAGWSLP
ncbi:MAG: hypothetical protein MJZ87_06275, partial [Bacteroidales bacterium]|nr:hypothetical protein [Bacteroidales bacterium]